MKKLAWMLIFLCGCETTSRMSVKYRNSPLDKTVSCDTMDIEANFQMEIKHAN